MPKDGEEIRYSKEEMSDAISKRVNEVTANLNAENKAAIDALRKELKPEVKPEKVYTRSELNDMVRTKKIPEADAQTIFDNQQTQQTDN